MGKNRHPLLRMATRAPSQLVQIGTVTRPHGIGGELQVELASRVELPAGTSVWLGYSISFARVYTLESWHLAHNRAIMKLRGISSRQHAERLREHGVFVEEHYLAAPPPQSTLGWRLRSRDGTVIGEVLRIEENPAHPLLVVQRSDGTEVLIPLVEAFIVQRNPQLREITVDLPDGLLEA